MQGQKSTIGSLPETLGFDRGSTPSDTGMEQQICWNNMRNSAQNQLSDYISPSNTSITHLNSTSQEGPNLSVWNIGEPSNQVSHNELKTEHGWSSSMNACAGAGPIFEERRYEPESILSSNDVNVNLSGNHIPNGQLFLQSSSSDSFPRDLNITSGYVGQGVNDCQVVECPNAYKSGSQDNVRVPYASSSSDPFGVPSGSGGYREEENDGRPGYSLEGRRLSCKRKSLEGNVGQSSASGSSNYFQRAEGSVWHAVPARCNASGSLSISAPSENTRGVSSSERVNARLGLGVGGVASESPCALSATGSAESSHRNVRLRINASNQQDSIPSNVFSTGRALGQSNLSSPYHSTSRLLPLNNPLDLRSPPAADSTSGHSNLSSSYHSSSRLLPINNSLDLRSPPAANNTNLQGQSLVHVPALRRNVQSARWNRSSSSRPGRSSRDAASREESNSRSMPRNISEHPTFVPPTEMINSAQNPVNWSLTGGNIGIAGNVASTSRAGSSSGVHRSSAPNWVPNRSPPQYPRRLSELVRRSLLSSTGSDAGVLSSSPPDSGTSASSQEMTLSSGVGNQGHHLSHARSAMLLDRQLDGSFGIPYSLRTLATASEGRSRLVSEIRNVLDLMRRGEGLRFEDVMILDQSVFFGMADHHDRHRDMRLDVDNMSYEELLALGERIGNVNTGLTEETILKRLKRRKYVSLTTDQVETEPCCICQEEYSNEEDIGALECGHDFHADCIKQWLILKNSCPICKTTAMVT